MSTLPYPLWLASVLLLLSLALPKLRARWPLWAAVAGRALAFVLVTLLVQQALGSPLQPRFSPLGSALRFWEKLIESGWWWLAARLVIGLIRLFVVLENRPRESRIVSDLLAGVITVATLLAVVNFAFEVPIKGLLATSGVIAIVLGLALQSTLSDVFSGIAVGLERPYEAGDLLWVEGGIEGRVVQINWRSTQIITGDNNIAVVPNSIIAKARLVNRSTPTPVRRITTELLLHPAVPFERCRDTLTAALAACRLSLPEPASSVACVAVRGDGTLWELGFSVGTSAEVGAARDEVLSLVHRHLRHAGIGLGVSGIATRPAEIPSLDDMLEQSDLLGVVKREERALLAPHFRQIWLHPGDALLQPGQPVEAMFLLAAGTVEVRRGDRMIRRMNPGESLGAVGLITGEPTHVTATALTTVRAWRIGRDELSAAIRETPSLALALEELARRGKEALSRDGEATDHPEDSKPEMFLGRLRAMLRALSS
ncbi:mechanosensitive ion channel family protein [Acetobacteraceae bacterium KSS8]|uniref:Small-conductance mechanosensitive channel n=1 Tax=Endosaccharibacter trunci TaxID=2812733 RepID=A0ABT1W4S8_9PROT|nr:mechanosensitive ion channel family protein [Acetobacteraceae bacterium KSS8]